MAAGRHRRAASGPSPLGRTAAVLLAGAAVGFCLAASAAPPVPASATPFRVTPPMRSAPAAAILPVPPTPYPEGFELRPASFTRDLPDDGAAVAITAAMAQIGLPYEWGGDGPTAGETGFDCSGLTHFAYAAAGIDLPRTAHTQYHVGPQVPPEAPLRPGDLVFYGVAERVHHVGLYLGDGRMVNAPTFGKPVQVAYYRWRGDDYLGATRPAGAPTDPGLLPSLPVPTPLPLPVPEVFAAPVAPLPEVLPAPDDPQPPEPESAAAALAAVDAGRIAPAPAVDPAADPAADPAVDPLADPAGGSTAPTPAAGPADPDLAGASPSPAAGPVPGSATTSPTPGAAPSSAVSASDPPVPDPLTGAPGGPDPLGPEAPGGPPLGAGPGPADRAPRAPAVTLGVPAGTIALVPVVPEDNGLPAAPGVLVGASATVIRIPETLATATPAGSAIVVTRADGSSTGYLVLSHTVLTAADAARTVADADPRELVVLAAGDRGWTVLEAG